jgi:hypothetical protein
MTVLMDTMTDTIVSPAVPDLGFFFGLIIETNLCSAVRSDACFWGGGLHVVTGRSGQSQQSSQLERTTN